MNNYYCIFISLRCLPRHSETEKLTWEISMWHLPLILKSSFSFSISCISTCSNALSAPPFMYLHQVEYRQILILFTFSPSLAHNVCQILIRLQINRECFINKTSFENLRVINKHCSCDLMEILLRMYGYLTVLPS